MSVSNPSSSVRIRIWQTGPAAQTAFQNEDNLAIADGDSDWNGSRYQLLTPNQDAVLRRLDELAIDKVIMHTDEPGILYQSDREYIEGLKRDGGVGQGPAFEALAPPQH